MCRSWTIVRCQYLFGMCYLTLLICSLDVIRIWYCYNELTNVQPGCLMAMGRFNRPSIMVYGGAIAPGHTTLLDNPKVINISTTFEAYGALLQGEMDEKNYHDIVRNACPGAG